MLWLFDLHEFVQKRRKARAESQFLLPLTNLISCSEEHPDKKRQKSTAPNRYSVFPPHVIIHTKYETASAARLTTDRIQRRVHLLASLGELLCGRLDRRVFLRQRLGGGGHQPRRPEGLEQDRAGLKRHSARRQETIPGGLSLLLRQLPKSRRGEVRLGVHGRERERGRGGRMVVVDSQKNKTKY